MQDPNDVEIGPEVVAALSPNAKKLLRFMVRQATGHELDDVRLATIRLEGLCELVTHSREQLTGWAVDAHRELESIYRSLIGRARTAAAIAGDPPNEPNGRRDP